MALLIGEKRGVSADTRLAFRRCGVSHLMVVSGLHVVTITTFFFELLRRLTRRPPKALALATAWILAALTAFSPSAVRAAFMLSVILCAGLTGREPDSLNSLGLVVFVMCVFNPSSARDLGFLLSVSATAGLIIFAPRLTEKLMSLLKVTYKTPRPVYNLAVGFCKIISQSVSAWAATLPITTLCFGGVSLIAPIANILTVEPATVTMILDFPAALVPVIGRGFLRVAFVGADWLIFITGRLARLPFSYAYAA